MKIKDLKEKYPLVYEAALINQEQHLGKRDDSGNINFASETFQWIGSKEGNYFWTHLYNGRIDEAKKLCPNLFEENNHYIVGKWYVSQMGSFFKYSHIENDIVKGSEWITYSDKIYINEESTWGRTSNKHKLADMTEMSKYLPSGHVDKIIDKSEIAPKRISFYVKYSKDFTEDLFNALLEWVEKQPDLVNHRDYVKDTYVNFQQKLFYVVDNWGINVIEYKPKLSASHYGVDNNEQRCKEHFSIEKLKQFINYREPVVDSTFKIGDYAVSLIDKSVCRKKGTIVRFIDPIKPHEKRALGYMALDGHPINCIYFSLNEFRLATPLEAAACKANGDKATTLEEYLKFKEKINKKNASVEIPLPPKIELQFNVGDVVVSKNTSYSMLPENGRTEGQFFKIAKIVVDDFVHLENYDYSVNTSKIRLATQDELSLYNQGYKNIYDKTPLRQDVFKTIRPEFVQEKLNIQVKTIKKNKIIRL